MEFNIDCYQSATFAETFIALDARVRLLCPFKRFARGAGFEFLIMFAFLLRVFKTGIRHYDRRFIYLQLFTTGQEQ